MNSINVLYVGGFEMPDKNAAAHRVMSNAKIIRDIGGNVVFAGIDKNLSWGASVFETKNNVQGFKSYYIPYPNGKKQWISYLTNIEEYIKIIEEEHNISVVIFYNFPSVAMWKMKNFCKKRNIKCVADVTEWYASTGKGIVYYLIKGIDTWTRMHFLHKSMDGLIVISRFLYDYYHNHHNIELIPPLVDKNEDKWKNLSSKTTSESLNLVYAGSPELKDRIDVLIAALKKVERNFNLNIIGLTKEQYLNRFPIDRSYLEENKKINFLGRLSHCEVLNYVSSSDYSCFFREDDRMTKAGFSTKFVEAISCGTPVLTNKTSNIEDFCSKDNNAILTNGISIDEISDTIEKLNKNMNTSQNQFDYRSYIENIKKLFLNL